MMKDNQQKATRSDFQLEQGDGEAIARRTTRFLPDGAYLFEDELEIKGDLTAKVIICTAWLLELYEMKAGELFFLNDEMHVRPRTKCFGVFYPPFTISQPCFKNAKGHLVGVAATESLPAEFTTVPLMFETTFNERPSGANRVFEIVNSGNNHQAVEMNSRPSLPSLKAKRLIDQNHLNYSSIGPSISPSIALIAARVGVTHEHLSRQFKRDFGMSPSAYLRQLRVADAPLKLAKGEQIVNVAQDVGYNDLSRFYKQFHKTTKTSPGVCQTLMKPHQS